VRRVANAASRTYARVAASRWFRRVVAAVFVIQGVAFVLSVVAVLAMLLGAAFGVEDARVALDESAGGSTVSSWIQVIAGGVAGAVIVRGVLVLRHSRGHAYRLFEFAILVDLMLAQPFAFLDTGFAATSAVAIDIALLAALRYLDGQEHLMTAAHASPGPLLAATR
jgi:hypothetical protein